MTRYGIVGIFLLIFLIGFIKIIQQCRKNQKKYDFAVEFIEKFRKYADSNGKNLATYGWLINRSNRMQNQLGGQGIIRQYKPLYAQYFISNYQILNMLPELRKAFDNTSLSLSSNLIYEYAVTIEDCMMRHIGIIQDIEEIYIKEVKNPIIWFREGVRFVTAFPFLFLNWLGILSVKSITSITSNIIFKAVSGIFAVVGFVGAIIGIVVGWESFLNYFPILSWLSFK